MATAVALFASKEGMPRGGGGCVEDRSSDADAGALRCLAMREVPIPVPVRNPLSSVQAPAMGCADATRAVDEGGPDPGGSSSVPDAAAPPARPERRESRRRVRTAASMFTASAACTFGQRCRR